MRFILAAIAFLGSAALLVVGWLQVTEARAADTVVATGTLTQESPLLVIPSDTLIEHAGTQSITISGDGPIRVAIGRQADIAGWVGTTQHEIVTLDDTTGALVFTPGEASADETTAPSILGNDLWFQEYEGDGELELQQTLPVGFALLVQSDGEAPAPSEVSISWPLDGRAPMAGPLLLGGGVLLLISLGLLLWALLSMRRRSKPQRQAREELESEIPAAVPAEGENVATTPAFSFERSAPNADDGLDASDLDPVEQSQSVVAASVRLAEGDAPEVGRARELDRSELHEESGHAWAPPTAVGQQGQQPEAPAFPSFRAPSADDTAAPPAPAGAGAPAAVDDPFSWSAPVDSSEQPESSAQPESASQPEPAEPAESSDLDSSSDAKGNDGDDNSSTGGEPPAGGASGAGEKTPTADAPAAAPQEWRRPRGRDRTQAPKRLFRLIPLLLVGSIALTGCSADFWPEQFGGSTSAPTTPTPTSSIDQALITEGEALPAVNAQQLTQILDDAAKLAQEADAANKADGLKPRFTQAAYQERASEYQAKGADNTLPGPVAFPTGEVVYAVPQASESWPKSIFVVREAGGETPTAPFGIMLTQSNARDAYKVASIVQLTPDVTLPEAAPAEIGAPGIDGLEQPLVVAPEELAAAYADVISNGDGSQYAALFSPDGDSLRTQIAEARATVSGEIDANAARIEFQTRASDDPPFGVQTLDGGAIVAVSIEEVEKLSARTQLATLSVQGRTAALAGASSSSLGFETLYTNQLMFYVPSEATGGAIQLLGFANTMTGARQLNANEVTYG
ncbi:hypothetical protein C5B85_05710 [Pseudoclavibacter sp. AY1F1]|uniref:hypothetical protein n=1 Tax=Pseudoclavibacter sp. AY1F1 TaxID=2080583 RepID=UPI000CE7B19B|nr:hypothetical protein [Pseudoclavibacter sp. AY1F1]PPF46133.1 hypothetical protein C5B85_05710 [Pseudoclavibacter sp. AY1F1]